VRQMQELAQETSGPIIAVRCPALPIRHSVSDLPPTSGKAALTTLRPLMGNAVPQSLYLFLCSAADGCMRASGFPTLRPFQNTGIVAVAVLGMARVRRCCLCFDRWGIVAAPESCAAMRYGRGPLAPRVLNAVKAMGHILPASQSPPHVGCMRF
jgi:hypothetical protein